MKIECVAFKAYEKGCRLGYCDLIDADSDSGIIYASCSYNQKDGKKWVNLPQSEYIDDGVKKYASIITIPDKEKYVRFQIQAREAIERFRNNAPPVSNDTACVTAQPQNYEQEPLPF